MRAALGERRAARTGGVMARHGRHRCAAHSAARPRRLRLARHRGLLVAIAVFAVLLAVVDRPGQRRRRSPTSTVSFLSSGGATLALAAIGQTLVILSGGFDLSAGAVISLVNVVLATLDAGRRGLHRCSWSLAGVGIGMRVGRLQRLLRRLPAPAADRRHARRRCSSCRASRCWSWTSRAARSPPTLADLLHRRRDPQPAADADRPAGDRCSLLWLLAASARASAPRSTPSAATPRRRARPAFATALGAVPRLCAGGRLLRRSPASSSARRPASGDPLVGNPMLLQIFAAVVVGGTRARRRARRRARLGRRRLHPDDRRQHPARAQRLRLLLDGRRGRRS